MPNLPGAMEPSSNLPVRTIIHLETPDKAAVRRFLNLLPLDANKDRIHRFFELEADPKTATEVADSYVGCCMFGRRETSAILVEKESTSAETRLLLYSHREHATEDVTKLEALARKAAWAESKKYLLCTNPLKMSCLPYVGGIELEREPFSSSVRMHMGLLSTLIAPIVGLLSAGYETGWNFGAGSLQSASISGLFYLALTGALLLIIPGIRYERGRYRLEL